MMDNDGTDFYRLEWFRNDEFNIDSYWMWWILYFDFFWYIVDD